MPYENSWVIEGCIVKSRFYGINTLEDVIESNTDIRDNYLEGSQRLVHQIIHLDNIEKFSRNIGQLNRATKIISEHPSMGWIVVMGLNNPFLSFLASTLSQLSHLRVKEVPSLDEAFVSLRHVDATLSDVLPD
ncbi:MAG: hypothetical protein ACPG7F_03260 [Aggregatilineales bacterium]